LGGAGVAKLNQALEETSVLRGFGIQCVGSNQHVLQIGAFRRARKGIFVQGFWAGSKVSLSVRDD
jgi:hypothetical protein